ncbi:glycosyltransferase, partial [Escherichia coli]|nr:glycosyltransferase [Escherichia coli]
MSLLFRFRPDAKPVEYPEEWPRVTILIPAHNEEAVIDGCLKAMRRLDYPDGRLEILVVNDRSRDGTRAIVDGHAAQDG